ncbi:MAG: hydrogenase accessory protein HypB [Candidatus Latescibacterota bacterium]|jgi:hydrogenase nickel incorporation protein HypB|nr:MAG: hydrogenase accessory protein HypB [Candidatus Latescibacterota bacterium]
MHEIRVGEDLRDRNREIAAENREHLRAHGIVALNVMSAPGAGKTSLLVRSIPLLAARHAVGVIEGDIQTTTDAERVAALGVPVYQIQTGGVCHLDAAMVHSALHRLDLDAIDLLIVENVGNLVCPAEFDLGEDARIMLLSVSEGDDKPKKYPLMFHEAQLLVLNKIDLLPHVVFDLEKARRESREIQPALDIIELSCATGEGIDRFIEWIDRFVEKARSR